jgi:N-acetylmuramoyl-L-alanine amidase
VKSFKNFGFLSLILSIILSSCSSTNPYKKSEKIYDAKLTTLNETISKKESVNVPLINAEEIPLTPYFKHLMTIKDSLSKTGSQTLTNGINTEWVGTVNFNLRKPNFVIIHHTAQDSLQQTIKTFTLASTQVSAHYVISKDGKIIQMLNDYLRAWHAGNGSWGKNTDINSASIGIELDNNGLEAFSDNQIISLVALLSKLKKDYNIPSQNFIGHSDIAPTRKKDPSTFFPWKLMAINGFGIWPDDVLEQAPTNFNVEQALKIIGYNTTNLSAAIQAFKLHFIQSEIDSALNQTTINTIYNIYKKT